MEVSLIMTRPLRFADLIGLLEGLGFDCTRRVDGQIVCEHRPSDTMILLAERPAGETVREQILFGVRLQLDQRGLLDRGEFDRRVARLTARPADNGVGRAATSTTAQGSER
jgi:hypothetical protein